MYFFSSFSVYRHSINLTIVASAGRLFTLLPHVPGLFPAMVHACAQSHTPPLQVTAEATTMHAVALFVAPSPLDAEQTLSD